MGLTINTTPFQYLMKTHKEYEDFIPSQELSHAVALADAERDHPLALEVPESTSGRQGVTLIIIYHEFRVTMMSRVLRAQYHLRELEENGNL